MKRLLLTSFCFLLIALAFQRRSETWSGPLPVDQPDAGAPYAAARFDETGPITEEALRTASTKAVSLIQRAQVGWSKKETCASCHHQLIPEIALNLARGRGVPVDEKVERETSAATFSFMKDLDGAIQRTDYIDMFFDGWLLAAASAAGIRPNLATAAYAQSIASRQLADGSWMSGDSRPPEAYGRFGCTAICALALQNHLPDDSGGWAGGPKDRHQKETGEKRSRLRRARAWLLNAQPRTTEDRVFQLLGLLWTGADQNARRRVANQLLAEQGKDGGWSELPGMPGDAYSTGEALVALRDAAGPSTTNDPSYRMGLRFLLRTQQPDGSWQVKSRLHPPAPVSPPYFDTGFPYEHEQFISIMGTTWAASALMYALPAKAVALDKSATPEPEDQPEWIRIALTGSAADLKKLLDGGMKADARTAGGTTALMMAARDVEKVKLLIERGADVNAHAATGVTPLMVAAQYSGNLEVVNLLLKKGARPNPDKEIEVTNAASALFFAVMAGDAKTVRALLDAGARPANMKLIGRIDITPLFFAVASGLDPAVVESLLDHGASPNEADGDGISALGWAAITNRPDTLRRLLARGADINHVDRFGMTPLLYAASIDYGDTEVMEKLIAAGADVKIKNQAGLTALELARKYQHRAIEGLLAEKTGMR